MAVDTVKLRSPVIDEGTACYLESQSILKQGVELSTGAILYELTVGNLEGSWDSRVMFKVCREDWVIGRNGKLEQIPCEPYLLVEASIHKFLYGQNIYGNPTDFRNLCKLFLNLLSEMFAGDDYAPADRYKLLPDADKWEVRRVDWAEMFCLTPAAQAEYFRALKNCKFPRRAVKEAKYDTAVHFPGKFTTLRIYGKGAEFRQHDYPRIKRSLLKVALRDLKENAKCITAETYRMITKKINALQRLADNRLRAEVQINADKLRHDFKGRYPKVLEITDDYLINLFSDQMYKLLKEGRSEMRIVRTYDEVQARLGDIYGNQMANLLFAFWLKLAVRGEDIVRRDYSKSRFYSNRKRLVDAGISWNASNVVVLDQETVLPKDFVPLPSDPRRCVGYLSLNSIFNRCPVDDHCYRKVA
ncbi:MAG: phage/plasmid replication protein, II/X family [Candidatus Accumulibacter sp.]|nr:phage/plasmid replication protein, II/X family [Accumulibacter sp.]